MTLKITTKNKVIGIIGRENKDKIDWDAYSHDSTIENVMDDYGFTSNKTNAQLDAESRAYLSESAKGIIRQEKATKKDATDDLFGKPIKGKSNLKKVKVESESAKLNKSIKKAKQQRKQEIKEMKTDVNQKLRSDRLAKKELRAAKIKDKIKRLKTADRSIAKSQAKLAKIMRQKSQKKQDMMTTTEYRSQFGRPLPKGNDGNILHATNHFTNHDQRSRSYETGGNILAVPHTMFSGKGKKLGIRENNRLKKPVKKKWF